MNTIQLHTERKINTENIKSSFSTDIGRSSRGVLEPSPIGVSSLFHNLQRLDLTQSCAAVLRCWREERMFLLDKLGQFVSLFVICTSLLLVSMYFYFTYSGVLYTPTHKQILPLSTLSLAFFFSWSSSAAFICCSSSASSISMSG